MTASVVVWYGREQVKFRGQFAVRAGRVLPVGGDRTVSYAEGGKSREFPPACPGGKKAKEKAYNTCCSQAVPHPGTGQARHCLTSVIRREPVLSVWYGRRQECGTVAVHL